MFYYVDVTKGKISSAKIRIGNQNVQYIDYFNLMKIDDKWWIVHKISTKE
ncbi:MAG: nuclear transport factor 2 family protein [Candidatus Hodarchaeales archaeon]